MKRLNAVLFALMMATLSLAGCFGGDDDGGSGFSPGETRLIGSLSPVSARISVQALSTNHIMPNYCSNRRVSGNTKATLHR